jgi:hypothetical protein
MRSRNSSITFAAATMIHTDDSHSAAFQLDPIKFKSSAWVAICRQLISFRRRGMFRVQLCVLSGVDRTPRRSCHVRQLCNLEVLGASTAITCFPSVPTIRTSNKSGKVQVATIGACVNIWASSDVMDAYSNLCSASSPCTPKVALRIATGLCVSGCALRCD